ncbi:MAG: hypothetical protein BWX44_01366 [Spirochaetes bacterium ADurb.Bin001]|nr:MAG: hypothetical protein BWX44_01366 [Spirochaetes bacterium ADurb.Bin001]
MTERRIFLSLGAVIFITAFLFIACPSGIPKGNGYVYIRCVLPGNLTEGNTRKTQSRLIGPESGWNIASYRLTFTSENGEVITKSIGKTGAELSLKAGNWSLLAEGLTADGAIIVKKETQVLAQAGKRVNIQIMMHLAQGKGSLQLALSPNQPLPQDWKYSLSLEYRGLPGDPTFQGPAPLSTDVPATQMDYQVNELESGNYSLAIQVKDTSSTSIAGCITTVLILPEQTSRGSCSISLPDPSATISLSTPKLELSADAAISVERYLNRNKPISVPFVIAQGEADLDVQWYQNGTIIEETQAEADQSLPGYKTFFSPDKQPDTQMRISMEVLLSEGNSGISQAFSHSSSLLTGPSSSEIEWIQSIDYKAALNPSLHNSIYPENAGTGNLHEAKSVATSPTGLIAVAGLDQASALHLFYSPYGEEATLDGNNRQIPSSIGWIRLWRDRIFIQKSEKNPDIASISMDGSMIAIAATAGKWIRVYRLENSGSISRKIDIISGENGAPTFENIRAMRFTTDSTRLFILANSSGKLLVLDIEKLFRGEPCCEQEFSITGWLNRTSEGSQQNPSETEHSSLGMQDMILLDDGWIAACSSTIKMVIFIRYSSSDCSFSEPIIFTSGSNSASLGDPKSIAFDEGNERCYVIGAARKLHLFEKSDPLSAYSLSMTYSLSSDLNEANSLALVKKNSGGAYLVAGGNHGLGIISLDADGHPITQGSLNSQEDNLYGIKSINNVTVLGESVISAGGSSGIVAMFDILGL